MGLKRILIIFPILFYFALSDEKTDTPTSASPTACNEALKKKFDEWKAKFEITYPSVEEETLRKEIFCANSKKVQSHNGSGNATYTRAENKHSDKTPDERNNNMLGAKKAKSSKVGNGLKTTPTTSEKTQRTKRTRTTRTRKTKGPVKNSMKTTRSTQRFTTMPPTTRAPQTVRSQPPTTKAPDTTKAPAVTTRKTTFAWTTKSPPTTRTKGSTASKNPPVTSPPSRPPMTDPPTLATTTKGVSKPEMLKYNVNSGAPPSSLNYTDGCTPAKDQYGCGACWAFSAVAVQEYWRNKEEKYANLSEQSILDCNNFSDDCAGGWPTNAFSHMVDPGSSDNAQYMYKQNRSECMQKEYLPIVTIGKVCEIEVNGNETYLMELLWKHGPISVVIYVLNNMYSYSGGIYYERNCPSTIYNHAVVLVGYGSMNGEDYWIIKNSWGKTWGYHGYGWMARNKNNHCAIATYAMFPC